MVIETRFWRWKREIITGCELDGSHKLPYLVRYTLWQQAKDKWRIWLHRFIRSDVRLFHDHPRSFTTIVLWRGYIEHTPHGSYYLGPLTWHHRPASHIHRVELINNKPAWTLLITGPFERNWGFYILRGWVNWNLYSKLMRCD